jgi:hypothetical protein
MAENTSSRPLTTEEVLREEAKAIHGDKAAGIDGKSGRELYCELSRLDSAALCLSGGGIRSAAFALGVIQALAQHPRSVARSNDGDSLVGSIDGPDSSLLAQFHYLSTVSGGGYIGQLPFGLAQKRRLYDDLDKPGQTPRRA